MKLDVVLVDTAGRMQDNEPLMRALAKVNSCNKECWRKQHISETSAFMQITALYISEKLFGSHVVKIRKKIVIQ